MTTRVLPTSATDKMKAAGADFALRASISGQGGWPNYVGALYREMVQHAPVVESAADKALIDLLTLCGNDPGHYAGYKNGRSMGRWIADAVLIALPELTGPKPPPEPLLVEKATTAQVDTFLRAAYRATGYSDAEIDRVGGPYLKYKASVAQFSRDSLRYALGHVIANVSRETPMKPKV